MATANRINLSPDCYVWAIQRAGLTVNGYIWIAISELLWHAGWHESTYD